MEIEEDRIHRQEDYLALILQVPEIKILAHQYSPEIQQAILKTIRDGILELGRFPASPPTSAAASLSASARHASSTA